MNLVDLDASEWQSVTAFHDALCEAIGMPRWHGRSIDAFIDSMIYGGINTVEPPYTIRIKHVASAPPDVRAAIELLQEELSMARNEFRETRGYDVEVALQSVAAD